MLIQKRLYLYCQLIPSIFRNLSETLSVNKVFRKCFCSIGKSNIAAFVLPTRVVIIDIGKPVPLMMEIRKEIEALAKKKGDKSRLTLSLKLIL